MFQSFPALVPVPRLGRKGLVSYECQSSVERTYLLRHFGSK